jgi:uncharacterized membrane protein YdjX (TVP38/TMEM64 family)
MVNSSGNDNRKGFFKPSNLKPLWFLFFLACLFFISKFTPLQAYLNDIQYWKNILQQHYFKAVSSYLMLSVIATFLGTPRIPLAFFAGLAFGGVTGFLISLFSTSLGSTLNILMLRKNLKIHRHQNPSPLLQKLTHWLKPYQWWKLALLRQLSLPGVMINFYLACLPVTKRSIYLSTLLGYIPLSLAAALLGSSIGKQDSLHALTQLLTAFTLLNLILVGTWKWMKLAQNQNPLQGKRQMKHHGF